jgi:hypothetical protein
VRIPSPSGWFAFSIRVNGLEFLEACLRPGGPGHSTLEVVIRDRQLGNFALHEEFLLEIQESQNGHMGWQSVSLTELKCALGKHVYITDSDFGWSASPCRVSPGTSPRPAIMRNERMPVDGDTSHVDRVHASLTQSRIRYQIVGGLDSRGRARGHLTLAVNSLAGAGMCLRRAGFFESPESKYVVIDSQTGWKVRLLEGRPRRSM